MVMCCSADQQASLLYPWVDTQRCTTTSEITGARVESTAHRVTALTMDRARWVLYSIQCTASNDQHRHEVRSGNTLPKETAKLCNHVGDLFPECEHFHGASNSQAAVRSSSIIVDIELRKKRQLSLVSPQVCGSLCIWKCVAMDRLGPLTDQSTESCLECMIMDNVVRRYGCLDEWLINQPIGGLLLELLSRGDCSQNSRTRRSTLSNG